MQEKFNQTHIVPGNWGKLTLNRNIFVKYSNTERHLAQCCYLYNMCLWILTWSQFFFSPTGLKSRSLCSVWCCLHCLCCLKFWKTTANRKSMPDSCTCLMLLYPSHDKCFLKICVKTSCFFVNLPSQCGFFQRSQRDDSVPRYHAVRIRKESPECQDGKVKLDPFEKKQWMTTWIDNESYSWAALRFLLLQHPLWLDAQWFKKKTMVVNTLSGISHVCTLYRWNHFCMFCTYWNNPTHCIFIFWYRKIISCSQRCFSIISLPHLCSLIV